MVKRSNTEMLAEFVFTEHTIECTANGCSEQETISHGDEDDAAEQFERMGWKATERNVCCPKHAEKKLKQ